MKLKFEDLGLSYIESEWKKVRTLQVNDRELPWAVWVRLYAPIPVDQNSLNDQDDKICKVWFLTQQGVEERNLWEYARFITVLGYRPWSTMGQKPSEAVWGHPVYEIALAAFAAIINEDAIYLELQWGRKWGRGYQMNVDHQGKLSLNKQVWVS